MFFKINFCLVNMFIFRRDKKDRGLDKDRSRKGREEMSEEGYEWSKYSNRNSKKAVGSQRSSFWGNHEQFDRVSHNDHDRWNNSQPRDRFSIDHKRDRFDYQRLSNFHRDRDHPRPGDKR